MHPKEHKALTHGQEMEFPLSKSVFQNNASSTCSTGQISGQFHERNPSYALKPI